jgi:hypothetical protein
MTIILDGLHSFDGSLNFGYVMLKTPTEYTVLDVTQTKGVSHESGVYVIHATFEDDLNHIDDYMDSMICARVFNPQCDELSLTHDIERILRTPNVKGELNLLLLDEVDDSVANINRIRSIVIENMHADIQIPITHNDAI